MDDVIAGNGVTEPHPKVQPAGNNLSALMAARNEASKFIYFLPEFILIGNQNVLYYDGAGGCDFA